MTVELKGSRSITSIDDRLIFIICLLQWVPCCSARVAVSSACKVIDHPVRCLFSPMWKCRINNSQGTCKQSVHPRHLSKLADKLNLRP